MRHSITQASVQDSVDSAVIADMISIAFFFLTHLGERTAPIGENSPFALVQIQLCVGVRRVSASVATDKDLLNASFITHTFTAQRTVSVTR
jgi:hypothetical protein